MRGTCKERESQPEVLGIREVWYGIFRAQCVSWYLCRSVTVHDPRQAPPVGMLFIPTGAK